MEKILHYQNPVIRGFHPDPSICKANGIYYLVCSSFQYFPGVPLFESRDLINWKLIGNVLTRDDQLPLTGAESNGGIYAPTLRYHNGRFYMVTTNVSGVGNFYVWTDDIYGEWSDIIPVDQDGIDPSLYFEDDTAYFMSNHSDENGCASIVQCEIDIRTGKKLTPGRPIWQGCGGRYLEGPHLYKIGNWYYLLAAEGGTEYGHMVVLARGKTPYGPFTSAPDVPVISNRDLGGYPLQGTGHGDLVCDESGNWWMVLLAFRQMGEYLQYHQLGREVCLIPVYFDEDGWLKTENDGHVLLDIKTERSHQTEHQTFTETYTFSNTSIGKDWLFIRNPHKKNYTWSEHKLSLYGTSCLSDKHSSPTFLGLRQQEMYGSITVTVNLNEGEGGISLYMDSEHHYDFALSRCDGITKLIKRRRIGDMEYIQQEALLSPLENRVTLHIDIFPEEYRFWADAKESCDFGNARSRYLSSEVAGGFTGVMIGLYAVKTGKEPAVFSDFCYYSKEKEG